MVTQRAVVLLSGGLDSSTAAAIARAEGRELFALTVDYGQRHHREVEAARQVGETLRVLEHRILLVDLAGIGASPLTDPRMAVPERRTEGEIGAGIAPTYVPARNTVLLGLGLAYAETVDADALYIGAHAVDYSGYPDCRPEFFDAFQRAATLGTKRGVEGRPVHIVAPLVTMGKAEIIRQGRALGVPFQLTWSCYHGRAKACGVCDSCQLRLKGFREAGLEDPLPYEVRM